MGTSDLFIKIDIAHLGLAKEVVVLEWLVKNGSQVQIGNHLVLIESEKSEIEMDSPASGRLEIIVAASDIEIPAGTTIGRIHLS